MPDTEKTLRDRKLAALKIRLDEMVKSGFYGKLTILFQAGSPQTITTEQTEKSGDIIKKSEEKLKNT